MEQFTKPVEGHHDGQEAAALEAAEVAVASDGSIDSERLVRQLWFERY